jgi:hypothetical protein
MSKTILVVIGVVLAYGISFGRLFFRFRGDKFIECASVTAFLVLAAAALTRVPDLPDWVVKSILPLVAIFCWLSVYFGLQQVYHALRRRKTS